MPRNSGRSAAICRAAILAVGLQPGALLDRGEESVELVTVSRTPIPHLAGRFAAPGHDVHQVAGLGHDRDCTTRRVPVLPVTVR